MTGTKHWTQTWLPAVMVVAALPLMAAAGFFMYVSVNSKPLHPNPQEVTSTVDAPPLPRWAEAVESSRRLIREAVSQQNLPGLSVAVGAGRGIVWAEGFGWSNLERKDPVGPATRFRIGHVSKALTSAGVGLLRDQGRLHLDDEVQVYVPGFPRKQWPVTLRQVMGHVAGVMHYRDDEWGDKPSEHCQRASEGLRAFADEPLLFEPETQYRYSTYGWVLVSAAVEAAADEPFFSFMQKQVFTPLGMADTWPDAPGEPMPNRATSYFRGNLGNELTTDVDYSCFAGGGAFLSTPSDLVRFGFAMSGSFLHASTVTALQTPQQLRSGAETNYGLGWMIDTIELAGQRTLVVGHASRTIEGASTSFLTFPGRGLVVAVTSNISFADMRSVAVAVAEAFTKAAPPAVSRAVRDRRVP